MSAQTKKVEIPLPSVCTADDEWNRHLQKPGLRAKWAGPCEAMASIFKRLKVDFGDDVLFLQAQTDYIEALQNFKNKSCPTFLSGILVKIIQGANAPLLEKTIKEQLEIEKLGGVHKPTTVKGTEILIDSTDSGTKASQVPKEEPRASIRISTTVQQVTPDSTPELSPNYTETFALIKPDAMSPTVIEGIMDQIRMNRFTVMKKKKVWLTPAIVQEFYNEHLERPFYQSLETYFTSGPCLALVLAKENAVTEWRELIGPANSHQAKENAPKTLRALFGSDNRMNAVFGSDSRESADREIEIFFGAESKLDELPLSDDDLTIKNSPGSQKTLCLIKFDDETRREQIIERIICRGIEIMRREQVTLTTQQVEELYPQQKDTEQWPLIVETLTKAPVLALVLKGENVIEMWKEMAGPESPSLAKEQFPCSIRALFGIDDIRNAVHCSMDNDRSLHEINLFFPHTVERRNSISIVADARIGTATNPYPKDHQASKEEIHAMLERTLALIKPDAYGNGKKEAILEKIKEHGFTIIKEQEVQLTLPQAQDFYREHQSKPFYEDLVNWMSGTPIYALVLEKENAVGAWRELAGPTNSVKAKEIAPNSIRALYGTDGSQNAVHGSDSPISSEREIQIIFGDSVSPFPDPLPGQAPIEPKRPTPRASQVEASKLATKSAENVLNLILGNEGAPKSSSQANLASSQTNLSNSKANLASSKANLASSQNNGSKANLAYSKANLKGSQNKLASSKPNLAQDAPTSGSKANLTSSKANLAQDVPTTGSKANLVSSRSNSAKNVSASNPKLSGSANNLTKSASASKSKVE